MSDFFEPPEAPEPVERPRRYRTPAWAGPPQWTLPGIVPIELVVAKTDDVAVCLTRIEGYPEGWAFDIVTMSQREIDEYEHFRFDPFHVRGRMRGGEVPDEFLRVGLQFSDGSKVTNLSSDSGYGAGPPTRPLLQAGGGGGSGGSWHIHHWAWPLPPEGSLTLVVEWPAQKIPLTRTELDAATVRDAAGRAQVVFSEQDLPVWGEDDDEGDPAEFQIIR